MNHADAESFLGVLHVIVGDSNMSEYTTFLKIGVACSYECWKTHGVVRDFSRKPIPPFASISHDMTCRRRVQLATGREISALDIQREFLDAALNYADRRGFNDEEMLALQMWEPHFHDRR